MSDATPVAEAAPDRSDGATPQATGLMADPVVRRLVYTAVALVIVFLVTVLAVLVTGVAAPTGPRSVAERQLMVTAYQAQGATGNAMAPYVSALVDAGDLNAARVALAQARASVSATTPPAALDLAEARLLSASGEYDKAATVADSAMNGFKATAESKDAVVGQDYYNAVLVKAYALVELGRLDEAVAAFDIYLKANPTASDIYIDRGNAKVVLDDKAGAEKDFREALKYVPYDKDAKAGLKKIGVAE
jgi:tetratricopeptide (TPR) repeat protein